MILDLPRQRGGGIAFDSPITSAKTGVTFDVTNSQDQRSTNTDGDPTMLNGIPRAGNSAVDVIPTMSAETRGIAKLGWGLTMTGDAIRKSIFANPLQEYMSSTDYNVKYRRFIIDGDANTYYPVAFTLQDGRDNGIDFEVGIFRYLGDTCNSSYPGNHSNGTSSLTLILKGRSNGWDGNCNRMNVEQFIQPYASHVAKIEQSGGAFSGIVVWLRGGGTSYRICSNFTFSSINVYYNRIDLGYSPYEYFVEPTTTALSWADLIMGATSVKVSSTLTFYCNDVVGKNTITASKVYNAVWNDYAELFERGSQTEPGDLIALDTTSSGEKYVLANENTFPKVVGVHSDEYGHLIGGENPKNDEDFLQYNLPRFIPVGLAGRVKTKVVGTCNKGDYLVASSIDGVARKYNKLTDDPLLVFGMSCEDKLTDDIEKIRVYLK